MTYRYRIAFQKNGRMRFIGHLDLLKLFQRAVRRAGVPVAYSQGFNPHQLMSFGLPLTLGFAGKDEALEIGLAETMAPEELVRSLNECLPEGLKTLFAQLLPEGRKTAAAEICAAGYRIILPDTDFVPPVDEVLAQKELFLMKKSKKGEAREDVRGDILGLTCDAASRALDMVVTAGSGRNLRPLDLLQALYAKGGRQLPPIHILFVTRTALLTRPENGALVSVNAPGSILFRS